MHKLTCETVRLAAQALDDGEAAPLGNEEIQTHLTVCGNCRKELEDLKGLNRIFQNQKRYLHAADLWPATWRF